MPPYSHQPVVRALYRAYLRFAHRVDQDAPELRHSIGVLPGVSAVQHVRHAFRKPRPFYDNELETSTCKGTELRQIQRGLKLLRIYDEKFRNRVPEIEDIIYRISTKRDSSHWVEEGMELFFVFLRVTDAHELSLKCRSSSHCENPSAKY